MNMSSYSLWKGQGETFIGKVWAINIWLYEIMEVQRDMGVRENVVLGHTDLKIVRQMCQSNDIVKNCPKILGEKEQK